MNKENDDIIAVHVYPKSGKDAIEGFEIDANGKTWLKVRVTSVAEDGKANQAVLKLLAKYYKCPKTCLEIVSGAISRYKIIKKR